MAVAAPQPARGNAITREQLLMKLGAAHAKAPIGWRLIDITVDPASASFAFALNRTRLRQIRRREGRYLLRTNLKILLTGPANHVVARLRHQ